MTRRERFRARTRTLWRSIVTSLTPSRSSRYGAKVLGVVIHTTESGEGSINGVVAYLQRPDVQVSSHYVVADIAPRGALWTKVVRLVPEKQKAWTAKSANPYFVQYELVGRASRSRADWLGKYRLQLETVAALVADDVIQYNLPIKRGVPGIVGHADLTKWGYPNDHWDPGPNFPWDIFLQRVHHYVTFGEKIVPDEEVPVRAGGAHAARVQ